MQRWCNDEAILCTRPHQIFAPLKVALRAYLKLLPFYF